ncbi:cilia- and flagella-associated protein 157-like [Ctenocephalides felis]|uniref:cilia- and flagella-associated protein 157-like n=1 Tax=Ctenocephalides felis TaxID=7515 RepID=UPI000E6E425B|nr:cilia- and flagella-associated protein 157-like [Ctenocephalides felis]
MSTSVKSLQEDRSDVIDHLKRVADKKEQEAETVRAELKHLILEREEEQKGFKKAMDDAKEEYRSKLKKMMEEKLFQLSNDFHDAAEICIADTSRRVIRENIALNNELDSMMANYVKLQEELKETTKRDKELVLKSQIDSDDIKYLHRSNFMQKELLKKFRDKTELLVEKQRVAEQNLHALRCSIAEQKRENEFEKKLSGHRKNIIKVTLLSVKAVLSYCNNKAMQMEEKFAKSYKILLDLEKLLASSKDLKELKLVTSDETVASLAAMYRIGDLGFTPPSSEMTVSEQQIGVITDIRTAKQSLVEGAPEPRSASQQRFEEVSLGSEVEGEESAGGLWSVDFAASIEYSSIETSTVRGSDLEERASEIGSFVESEVTEEEESLETIEDREEVDEIDDD